MAYFIVEIACSKRRAVFHVVDRITDKIAPFVHMFRSGKVALCVLVMSESSLFLVYFFDDARDGDDTIRLLDRHIKEVEVRKADL